LLKRAESLLREDFDEPYSGHEIASELAGLTVTWWGSTWPPDLDLISWRARRAAGITAMRMLEATAVISAGRPVQLLAEPEFGRGAISPDRLLERLKSWADGSLLPYDLEIAMLRLAPGADGSFWSAWAELHPASPDAARKAYEQGTVSLSFKLEAGPLGRRSEYSSRYEDAVPVASARITTPSAESGGSHCWSLLTKIPDPPGTGGVPPWHLTDGYDAIVAALPLMCPWQPELASAHLLQPLSGALEPGMTTAVSCLSDPGHMLGKVGHLVVLDGLASADSYIRVAAAEVWTKASLDGRLDPALAAAALVPGATSRAFKLNRIAEALRHAAHDPTGAYRSIQTIYAAADDLVQAKPANLHLLLELAGQIGAATALPDPPASITALAAGKSATKLTAAARRLRRH
jgi:hypothetical protein